MARSTGKLLLSASALRITNVIAQVVVSFFLTPFVIRSLGDRLNGFWVLVATFIGYYGLMELGLGAAVSRYIAEALGKGDREKCGRVFTASVALYSVLGAILMILTGIIALLSHLFVHSPQDAHLFSKIILVLGLSVGISFPARAYSGLLTAELRFDVLAATDFFYLLLRTGLIVSVLSAGGKVLALAWVTFLAGLPRMAIYIFASRKLCPWLRLRASPWFSTETKRLLSYSAYAFVSDIADRLRFNIDAIVITGMVGLSAVTLSACLGVSLGLLAGFHGGRTDALIMRVVDVFLAIPYILLAMGVVFALGPSLLNVILVMAVTRWVQFARIVRADVLSLREREFVAGARARGNRSLRLLLRHVLPNALTPIIVVATLELAFMIIYESALSFLGLGVQPPTPTWGWMLSDGRNYVATAWWLATFPGLAIMLTVLAVNLLGDWLRDTLDPRLRVQ